MTDDDKDPSTLTEEQQKAALDWVSEKWSEDFKCECCGQDHWLVENYLVTPAMFSKDAVHLGKALPLLPVVCKNCKNTKFISALSTGIMGEREAQDG